MRKHKANVTGMHVHVLTEEVDKAWGGFRIFQSNYWAEPPTSDADQSPGSQSVF